MSGSETRAAKTHPALALLRAGQVAEAITYLKAQPDLAPVPAGALALLEAGFIDYGTGLLEDMRQDAPGRPQAVAGSTDTRQSLGGPQHAFQAQETAYQRRRA